MILNTAGQRVGCQMVSASDGSAFTGSVTVAVTVDAGTQATGSVGSGACTHEGNGYHTYAPAQAETNGALLAFTFTGTGAVPATVQVYTVAGDAFTRLGAPAGASVSADIAAVKAETADILTDTGTTLQGELDGIQADTEDIQSRLPAALVSGRIDASVGAMAANVLTATAINADAFTAAKFAADVTTELQSGLATAANLATVAGYLDTEIAAILADTNELQTDWANGGRLDNILDARASQTSVDDLPTNAELATSQAAADDATLAAIAALNNLSAAQVNAEVDAALADIHLDHLLAATYDPASKPGAADALLNELVESDSGVARFTANALEQAPSGGGGLTLGDIADAVWDEDLTGHTTPDSAGEILGNVATGTPPTADAIADEVQTRTIAAVTLVNGLAANTVTASALAADAVTEMQSGLATAAELAKVPKSDSNVTWNATAAAQLQSEAADALNAYDPPTHAELTSGLAGADDATLAAIAALNNLSSAQAQSAAAAALAAYDPPTNAEMEARTLAAASYATAANQSTIIGYIDTEIAAIISAIAALNNISTADVLTQVQSALTATIADTVPSDGTRPSISSGIYMLVQFMLERSVSGTTVTVRKPDGSTSLFALALNDASTPTSITRSS